MSILSPAPRIVGYGSALSVRGGETIRFHVSGSTGGRYSAAVHRLLGGGLDPRAPQLATREVASLGEADLLDQRVPIGSYGEACWAEPIATDAATIVVGAQHRLGEREQTLVWLGGPDGVGVVLGADGRVRLMRGHGVVAQTARPVPTGRWVRIVAAWDGARGDAAWAALDAGAAAGADVEWSTGVGRMDAPAPVAVLTLAARPSAAEGRIAHFTGRLEHPVLLRGAHRPDDAVRRAAAPDTAGDVIAAWDFGRDIPSWTVPGLGEAAADLVLHQSPVRGVRGSAWSAATDYREQPEQYAAIHFHEDALEDCEWVAQTEWTVPVDARSGFYALRVEGLDADDWIPFFVRPPVGAPTAELLVVASSATYFAYGNSRFWWEDPIQEIAQDRLVELGPHEQYLVTHPELGLSNYDRHVDDAPVIFSSRRRPNLFMRPGHTRAESYASDLYLIAWLEHRGIPYDVITDEDLHFDGEALLAPYRAVVSGSHPEYLSVPMYDATRAWVEAGGRYLYLGGNGFTSCVTWRADRPWLMENRATGNLQNDAETIATESVNQLDGERGLRMDESGRSPGSLWGVDTVTMGFDRSYPVVRSDASYADEFAWLFEGIGHRLFGGRSLSGGGVIGQEWDNARKMVGTPGHFVLASSIDHSLIPMVLGADPVHHGDVTAFFHADGLVVSASAMAWVGALHVDDYDNDAERFVRNVVSRFLDPAPIPQPAPTSVPRQEIA